MPANNTVAFDRHALGTLNYIRASIEAAGSFVVPGTAGLAMGVIGIAAAAASAIPAGAGGWIGIWITAAMLAAVAGGVVIARQSSRGALLLYSGPARKFLACLLPALLAGALLTIVLIRAHEIRLLAGTWLLLYGCAVLSASIMTAAGAARLVAALGALFMLLGALAFALPLSFHNLLLGAGFGLLHLLFGFLIGRAGAAQARAEEDDPV